MINRRKFLKFIGSSMALCVVPFKAVQGEELAISDMKKLSQDLNDGYKGEISLEEWVGKRVSEKINKQLAKEMERDVLYGSGIAKQPRGFLSFKG